MTPDSGAETKQGRQAERRRKQFKKRLRRPWLIFRHRMRRYLLEPAATRATGLRDFGDDYYASGLDTLLDSLRDAELTFLGRMITQRAVVLGLKQRLLITEMRKRRPEFFTGTITPPIIVTGLPRTGTTLLHRLLAEDPELRAPTLGELVSSARPSTGLSYHFDRLRLGIELYALRRFTPNLDAMHLSGTDMPEECIFALNLSFRSMLFWTLAPCYSYMDWYSRASRGQKYRDYRDILLLLQSHSPGRRLVLKAPDHLGSLAELFTVVPEAMLVVCHRPAAEAVTSFNSLTHALHQAVSSAPDPLKIGDTNLRYFEGETRRYVEARKTWAHRILEVDYAELAADPLAVVRRIYGRAGLPFTPDLERRFAAFMAANPKNKLGRHSYDASDFGQSEAMIAGRLAHYAIAR
jgi:hypothetical protein